MLVAPTFTFARLQEQLIETLSPSFFRSSFRSQFGISCTASVGLTGMRGLFPPLTQLGWNCWGIITTCEAALPSAFLFIGNSLEQLCMYCYRRRDVFHLRSSLIRCGEPFKAVLFYQCLQTNGEALQLVNSFKNQVKYLPSMASSFSLKEIT